MALCKEFNKKNYHNWKKYYTWYYNWESVLIEKSPGEKYYRWRKYSNF